MKKRPQKGDQPELFSNKFYQALVCLGKEDRKKFAKFLASPYFVQSPSLLNLYLAISAEADLGKSYFDRGEIWKQAFAGKPYDDVNFRKFSSELFKLLHDFIAHEQLSNDPARKAIEAMEYVAERSLEPLYKPIIKEAGKEISALKQNSIKNSLYTYQYERKYYTMMDFDVKVDQRANLDEISRNLDVFYWIEKLRIASAAISQRKTGNEQYNIAFTGEIKSILEGYPMEGSPELALYYHSFLAFYEPENIDHYYNLKILLENHSSRLESRDALELVDAALHYCTGRMNRGESNFFQEYFDLFVSALKQGILFQNGMLAQWRFNNMVGVALRLGKLDWAEEFIENYSQYLPANTRTNTHSFNLARVYRFQGKFHKVQTLLQNVEYEDIGYNLISKMMLLITYYEIREFEILQSFLEAFRVFLVRHKNIARERRQSYLNLIKYTRKLLKLDFKDRQKVERLRKEVLENRATIVNHEWLLEKLS